VIEGEICVVLGLFMLKGIIHKLTLTSYFTTKSVISIPGFEDVITRDRIKLICTFLHSTDNESFNNFQGPKKLFRISQ
jgi:hypothetical protein